MTLWVVIPGCRVYGGPQALGPQLPRHLLPLVHWALAAGEGVPRACRPRQPPCAQTKPPAPPRASKPTKGARGCAWDSCRPSPTCPEHPHPPPATWPLGWGARHGCYGSSSGEAELGNYCAHPSCLLPGLEPGASSRARAAPPHRLAATPWSGMALARAGWQEPLSRCPCPARP